MSKHLANIEIILIIIICKYQPYSVPIEMFNAAHKRLTTLEAYDLAVRVTAPDLSPEDKCNMKEGMVLAAAIVAMNGIVYQCTDSLWTVSLTRQVTNSISRHMFPIKFAGT